MQEPVLFLAKAIASEFISIWRTIAYLALKGDERQTFLDYWEKKVRGTLDEIKNSATVEQTMDILNKFRVELAQYMAAKKVDTADKAMDIAHSFIKKYSPIALPLKAVKEDDIWLVDIDVGALTVKIAKVKVDARTGDILSYEIPEK